VLTVDKEEGRVVGLELSLAHRLAKAPETGEAQAPGSAAATPPEW
jgi:hypothetical protein